jgi:DME family drug/metabolite transporter
MGAAERFTSIPRVERVSRHTAGCLIVAGLATAWGLIAIIVRELDGIAPMVIVFFRVALAGAAVAAVLALTGRGELLRWPGRAVLGLGVLLAVHWSLYFSAINHTSVASAVLITYAAPIFMAVLAAILLREHVPRVSVVALAVSLGGVAAISLAGGGGGDGEAVRLAGVILALLAAITYAFLIVSLKRFAGAIEPVTVVFWQSVAATAVLAPAAAVAPPDLDAESAGYLLALGVALTGVTGVLYVAALRWIAATTAGILAYMEPVSAALLAAALLGEHLTLPVVLGGAAIVGAGVAVVLRVPDPLAAPVEEPVVAPSRV